MRKVKTTELQEITIESLRKINPFDRARIIEQRLDWLKKQRAQDKKEYKTINKKIANFKDKERTKKYYRANKEKILARHKEYYQKNKEKLNKYAIDYYYKHKEDKK